jgi:hypothetical protein
MNARTTPPGMVDIRRRPDESAEQALTGDPDDKKSKPVEQSKPAGKDGPK